LARPFSKPANVLVLNEPTNDLDVETREFLEGVVAGFAGTVRLVSHDRALLDNVVTSSLVLQGQGTVRDYGGGYAAWARRRRRVGRLAERRGQRAPSPTHPPPATEPARTGAPAAQPRVRRKLRPELEARPARLERLGGDLELLQQ